MLDHLQLVGRYEPIRSSFLCQSLCSSIRNRCQDITLSDDWLLNRTQATPIKLMVNVVIGQDLGQGFYMTCSSQLQHLEVDERVECVYRNQAVFAVVMVHAVVMGG